MNEFADGREGWNTRAVRVRRATFETFFQDERVRLFRALAVITGSR